MSKNRNIQKNQDETSNIISDDDSMEEKKNIRDNIERMKLTESDKKEKSSIVQNEVEKKSIIAETVFDKMIINMGKLANNPIEEDDSDLSDREFYKSDLEDEVKIGISDGIESFLIDSIYIK